MNKIFIMGFPHSGTTILRCVIGHIDEVEEIIDEVDNVDINDINSAKKYILYKYAEPNPKFFEESYKNIIKIFIIRNPVYVFSSLNERYKNEIPPSNSLEIYNEIIKRFIYYENNKTDKNIYTIKYEDLFNNNYEKIKNILDNIGIQYTNKIFNNTEYKNYSHTKLDQIIDFYNKNLSICPPEVHCEVNHKIKRNDQVNQPFVSNNNINKINLTKPQKEYILNNKNILYLYPDINDLLIN